MDKTKFSFPAYYNEIDPGKSEWLRELIRQGVLANGIVDTRSIGEIEPQDLAGFAQCHFFAGFGEQSDDAIGYGWLDLVQTDLERENYAVGKAVLGACSVGAPHIRQRLYFVAHAEASEAFARPGEVSPRAGTNHANGLGIGGDARELEFSDGGGREARESAGTGNGDGSSAIAASASGELADADGRRLAMHGSAHREAGHAERSGESDLGESIGARLEGHARHGADGHESRWFGAHANGSAATAGHVNGFWRDADWILRKRWNRDDWEWCPAEPGTFPLVAGSPARVLRLRGYGDAICAPLAAEFIQAFLETQAVAGRA